MFLGLITAYLLNNFLQLLGNDAGYWMLVSGYGYGSQTLVQTDLFSGQRLCWILDKKGQLSTNYPASSIQYHPVDGTAEVYRAYK